MPIIDNPELYKKAKEIADAKYAKPSAYKSGFIVKTYKEMGGTYTDDKKPKKLARWYKEDWKDIGGKEYPVYRPTKRITKDTPLTVAEIDPKQAKKQIALKQIIRGEANLPKFKEGGRILSDDPNLKENNYSKSKKKEIANEIKDITREEAIADYHRLENINPRIITSNIKIGNKFVDYFTFPERLETIGKAGINYYDLFYNKSYFQKKGYIANLIRYIKENNPDVNIYKLWSQVFNLYFSAINIYKPALAFELYSKYKPNTVLDFTMGWGGRLVAACALNIPHYIGIDLNKSLEKPYGDMVRELNQLSTTKITLYFKDALAIDYSKLKYDMVFTSPPYYNKEVYAGNEKLSKDEWDEQFYIPIFTKTYNGMARGGWYCLNIPVELYERVCLKLFGGADKKIPLKKKARQKGGGENYKEYIYVWKKG